jgi:hypothetical protein
MKRNVVVVLFVLSLAVAVVPAQETPAAQPAAAAVQPAPQPAAPAVPAVQPAGPELRQQIAALEREARKNDPTLNAKLDDIEKQRRQVLIQAKPELEALYAQQDAVQEQAKAGKRGGPGGKAKQGGGGAKAEKKAERATQKAEKEALKAEQK